MDFDFPVDQIIYDNQLVYPYKLAVGQALLITNGEREAIRGIAVNGYAYTFISNWVLNQTLPFLTNVSVFSYGFTTSGELIPPVLSDNYIIEAAYQFGTYPILTLTPLDETGQFNNYLIHEVVSNEEAKANLIHNVLVMCEEKGFHGVDIDFEYILPEDKEAFPIFVKEMTTTLNEVNIVVSVALAPKTSDNEVGLLYEGKDYKAIGEAANYVLLMTYEWGYTYGPPMAVAPVPQVEAVVRYAVSKIDHNKISLGIPNYGYDWPLPFVKGVTKADSIGIIEAIQIAIEQNAVIHFDETSKSPYFFYQEEKDGETIEHEVWFEDIQTLPYKLELVEKYQLRGVGYWQIMQLYRANWLLLRDTFYTLK